MQQFHNQIYKMKLSICLTLFFIIIGSQIIAQSVEIDEIYLRQLFNTNANAVSLAELDKSNMTLIDQFGTGNEAVINQHNTASVIPGNLAVIYQFGLNNSVNTDQTGYYNSVDVLQFGISNEYNSDIEGTAISTTINQYGISNNIQQELNGNNLNYTINQYGLNNEVIQQENGSGTLGNNYEITQVGAGIKVTIIKGTFPH